MFLVRGKAWPSLLIAHLQNRLQWKGDVSERLRKLTMRSGRWHSRELWSSQYCYEMIELVDSRAWSANSVLICAESVREVHSILPCDFPLKSGSWIYFINVGIHLLMCSGKLCCVPDFGDFCSWKRNFGVGKYGCITLVCMVKKPQGGALLKKECAGGEWFTKLSPVILAYEEKPTKKEATNTERKKKSVANIDFISRHLLKPLWAFCVHRADARDAVFTWTLHIQLCTVFTGQTHRQCW